MLRHFLKMSLRNLKRNKVYSLINIMGLAIGMASSLILLLWIIDELSYDRFHKNSHTIFRIIQERKTDRIFKTPSSPTPLAPALRADYPEIAQTIRLQYSGLTFKYGQNWDEIFDEAGFIADKEFLQFFTFPLLLGNPAAALNDPHSIVITEKMAQVCFGKQQPLGKTLTATNGDVFQVSGVLENIPGNSHLQFEFVIPFEYLISLGHPFDRWNVSDVRTYLQLRKDVDSFKLNKKIETYVQDRVPEGSSRLILQPLTKIHLYSLDGGGPIVYVSIVSMLSLFILIIACINFTNLSTARFGKRSREVGIKKVVGARRPFLIGQFFGESFVLCFISALIAFFLIFLLLPGFSRISGKAIGFEIIGKAPVILTTLLVILFTGILSGIYPALFLSSFSPIKIFKGFTGANKRILITRRILVVSQFTISLILIVSTLGISKQLHFVRNMDLGFNKENLAFFSLGDNTAAGLEIIKYKIKQIPFISHVTATNAPLLWLGIETTGVSWEGKKPGDIMNVQIRTVDYDYLQTFEMTIKEGRFFSQNMTSDATEGFILNESAVKAAGLESPVGKRFSLSSRDGKIIGVVKDFYHHSVHEEIEPVVFLVEPSWNNYIFVRIKPEKTSEAVQALATIWKDINPDQSFNLHFFDEEIDNLYRSETELSSFINIFSILAVFISCLGLFGLASYATEQRKKEIGIRKVLGASVSRIQILLSKEFLKWVLLANVISWPIAYYAMHLWLKNFAYRISIGIGIFVISAVMVFIIAIMTVSYQCLRAASTDPVKSLRYE